MVLLMDANEDVVDGAMCRQLSSGDIGIREVVHSVTGAKGPNTHFKGVDAIDGIWVTKDIEVSSAAYLSYDPELGDHRPVVSNTTKRSQLGKGGPQIKKVACHRLNLKLERIRKEYIDRLKENMKRHNVLARIDALEKEADGEFGAEARKALEHLDNDITAMMMSAEKSAGRCTGGTVNSVLKLNTGWKGGGQFRLSSGTKQMGQETWETSSAPQEGGA